MIPRRSLDDPGSEQHRIHVTVSSQPYSANDRVFSYAALIQSLALALEVGLAVTLSRCNETMLLSLNIFNSLNDPNTHTSIAACVADFADDSVGSSNSVSSLSSTSCLSDQLQKYY